MSNLVQMYCIGFMSFILFLSTLISVPVLADLSKQLGAGATSISIVTSAALATVVIAQFFTGILADRYSRRALIVIGALLGAVSSFLCAAATHWTQLAALRVIGGIADAIAMPALLAITATLGSNQPGKFFGILRSSQGLSFIVGPAIGSALSLLSLRMPFVIDGILSLFACAAAMLLIKKGNHAKAEHDLGVFRVLRQVFSDRRVYLYALMGISGFFAFGIFFSFIPAKAQTLGLVPWQIGFILSAGAAIFSVVSYGIGAISDRLGHRGFVIAAQVFIVAGGVGLIFSHGFKMLLISYCMFCIGETITFLLSFVYARDCFDPDELGTSMGAFDSVIDLALFLGPLTAIVLYKSTAHFAPVFIMAIAPAAIAFISLLLLLPRIQAGKTSDK